jgi:hypothetical protein
LCWVSFLRHQLGWNLISLMVHFDANNEPNVGLANNGNPTMLLFLLLLVCCRLTKRTLLVMGFFPAQSTVGWEFDQRDGEVRCEGEAIVMLSFN